RPTFVPRHWWERILHNRDVLRLRPFLKDRPCLRLVDFPYQLYEDKPPQRPAPGSAPAQQPRPSSHLGTRTSHLVRRTSPPAQPRIQAMPTIETVLGPIDDAALG